MYLVHCNESLPILNKRLKLQVLLTKFGRLIPQPLQAATSVAGSESPLQNLITNYELFN